MLGQGGLSAAIVAQNGHKGAFLNIQTDAAQHNGGHSFSGDVGEAHILGGNDGFAHSNTSLVRSRMESYLLQRPVAPQGSTRPVWVTGRPSSSLTVWPPNFLETTVSRM